MSSFYNGTTYYYDDIAHIIDGFRQLSVTGVPKKHNKSVPKKHNKNSQTERARPKVKQSFSTKVPVIIDRFVLNINPPTVYFDDFQKINDVLTYTYPNKYSHEYNEIKNVFRKYGLIVKMIKKVQNPYLKKAFEMKRQFHYGNVKPQMLFHGTKQNNIDSICTYNFNWRLSGLETGHKYGKGVNFSKNPYFATFFCDKRVKKVIIMADVLIKETASGSENLLVPPRGYDTTHGKGRTVFVKFYDNEFYPKYVINFLQIKATK